MENKFGELVANVDKQQCQLCHQEEKQLRVRTASESKQQVLAVSMETVLSNLSLSTQYVKILVYVV